jgi:hypothetical protein
MLSILWNYLRFPSKQNIKKQNDLQEFKYFNELT